MLQLPSRLCAGAQVDYEGNRNVIESAGILGVTRVILVTSVGCGDSKGAISEQVRPLLSLRYTLFFNEICVYCSHSIMCSFALVVECNV
jgi:hypothetical protein